MKTKIYLKDNNVVIENQRDLNYIPTRCFRIDPEESVVSLTDGLYYKKNFLYENIQDENGDLVGTKKQVLDYLSPFVGFSTASGSSEAGENSLLGSFLWRHSEDVNNHIYSMNGQILEEGVSKYSQIASLFPSWVQGNDLVLPDWSGRFIRNIGGDSMPNIGDLQSDEIKEHSHGYTRPPIGQFTGRGNGSNVARRGQNSNVKTSNFGGSETRPKNVTLMICLIAK